MSGPDPDDELAIFNREWLGLLKASINAGFVCSACKTSVPPADVAGLMLVAERAFEDRERLEELEGERAKINTAMSAFARDLLAVIEGEHHQHLTLLEGARP